MKLIFQNSDGQIDQSKIIESDTYIELAEAKQEVIGRWLIYEENLYPENVDYNLYEVTTDFQIIENTCTKIYTLIQRVMPFDWQQPLYKYRIKAPCNVVLSAYSEFWRTLYSYASSAGFPSYPYMVVDVPFSEVYFYEIAESYLEIILAQGFEVIQMGDYKTIQQIN